MKKKILKLCAAISIITLLMGFTSMFIYANNVTENPEFENIYDYTSLYFPDTITFNASTADEKSFTIDNYTGTQIKGLQRTATEFSTAYGENKTTIWMRRYVDETLETNKYVYLKHRAIPFDDDSKISLKSYFVRSQSSTTTLPPEDIIGRTIVWRYNDRTFTTEALNHIQRSANDDTFKTDTSREGFIIMKEGDWSMKYINYFVDYYMDTYNNMNGKSSPVHFTHDINIYGEYNEASNQTTFIVPWIYCDDEALALCGLNYNDTKYYKITNATCLMQMRNEAHQQISIAPNEFYTNTQLDYDAYRASTFMKPMVEQYNDAHNHFLSSIENYDFSSWLTRSLNGFWNFQIFNDVTIGLLLTTVIGIAVVMAFLRMFHA